MKIAENSFITSKDSLGALKRFWSVFHNMIIVSLIFTFIGVGIGIHVCKKFYTDRLDEIVTTGAMLHKHKIYVVSPKI